MSSQTIGPLTRTCCADAALVAASAAPPAAAADIAGLPVLSYCMSCRLGDGAAGEVVDDDRTVEPGDRGLGAVELFHPLAPFAVVDPLGRRSRLPEIDAAGDTAVLGTDVVFPDQARKVLVFRRARFEALCGLGERDRRRQLELHDGGDHDRVSSPSSGLPEL